MYAIIIFLTMKGDLYVRNTGKSLLGFNSKSNTTFDSDGVYSIDVSLDAKNKR